MKTGLVSISFRKLSPIEIIDLVKKSGLESIEWGGDVHVQPGELALAEEIGCRTREAGLEVACYGSYCRLTSPDEFSAIIATAKALGAPLIRVWAGRQGSADCTLKKRTEIVQNARLLAELAAQEHWYCL